MKNGFTLIELLAVIVILAIIALIATPIVLNIINDSRDSANERSVELYGEAVENAVATYQLKNKGELPNSIDILSIDYSGNRVNCTTKILNTNGTVYLAGCKVGNDTKEYTYGTEPVSTQVYIPQYYSWSMGNNIGGNKPADAEHNASDITTDVDLRYATNVYLGFDVNVNDKVSAAYICFVRNGTEYCLKGNDASVYSTNVAILDDAFSDVVGACGPGATDDLGGVEGYRCDDLNDFYVTASESGFVLTHDGNDAYIVYVSDSGSFGYDTK